MTESGKDDTHLCDITVLILTYNHAPYIAEALRSVQNQTFPGSLEILIADDCSSDGTTDVAIQMVGNDPRVRLLDSSTNRGMQHNFRRALEQARGKYVALLEGDDYWVGNSKLSTLKHLLDNNTDYSAACHLTEVFVESTGESLTFGHGFGGRHRIGFSDVMLGVFPHASSIVFHRSLLPTTPDWFDDLSAADWAICGLLAAVGPVGVHREIMSTYRKNATSSWTPRPQLERKLLHLQGLEAFAENVPQAKLVIQRPIATAHAVVAAVAIHDRRPVVAARHGAAYFRSDPLGAFKRILHRLSSMRSER